MNCSKWIELSTREKIILTGEIIHLLQNDAESFDKFSRLIKQAKKQGKFEGTTILPPTQSYPIKPDERLDENFKEVIN